MQSINFELLSFIKDKDSLFNKSHQYKHQINPLEGFLAATMDEARICYAIKSFKELLDEIRAADAKEFQTKVLARELTGDISYPKQRDHTCHTLNNYLLGWYIFSKSELVFNSVCHEFRNRKLPENSFFGIWMYVSLLHDIGYMFEGSFQADQKIDGDILRIGLEVLNNYFARDFWQYYNVRSIKSDLLHSGVISIPVINKEDLVQLAHSLSSMVSFPRVYDDLKQLDLGGFKVPEVAPEDCFSLWELNYQCFDASNMAEKIKHLRELFFSMAKDGMPGTDIRILDHGVTGGAILLNFVTFFYEFHLSLLTHTDNKYWNSAAKRRTVGNYFTNNRLDDYPLHWWWSGLVWATCATAFHNLLHEVEDAEPLDIADDPLTYLGILVDELQMWDRFSVFNGLASGDVDFEMIPIQSSDIKLGSHAGKVVFCVPQRRFDKIWGDLDKKLSGWAKIVDLNAY